MIGNRLRLILICRVRLILIVIHNKDNLEGINRDSTMIIGRISTTKTIWKDNKSNSIGIRGITTISIGDSIHIRNTSNTTRVIGKISSMDTMITRNKWMRLKVD